MQGNKDYLISNNWNAMKTDTSYFLYNSNVYSKVRTEQSHRKRDINKSDTYYSTKR